MLNKQLKKDLELGLTIMKAGGGTQLLLTKVYEAVKYIQKLENEVERLDNENRLLLTRKGI
jgi:hypothetical protein